MRIAELSKLRTDYLGIVGPEVDAIDSLADIAIAKP